MADFENCDGGIQYVKNAIERLKKEYNGKHAWHCICECYDSTILKDGIEVWINKYDGENGEFKAIPILSYNHLKDYPFDSDSDYVSIECNGRCPICYRWLNGTKECKSNEMNEI